VTAGIAAGAAITALGATAGPSVGIPLLWVIAVVSGAVSGLCLVAHRDANRGRVPKRAEIVVEEIDDPPSSHGRNEASR